MRSKYAFSISLRSTSAPFGQPKAAPPSRAAGQGLDASRRNALRILRIGNLRCLIDWPVLGAIQGANGVILLGWSTAFFISVVAGIRAPEHDWSGAFGQSPLPRVQRDMK